MGRLAIRRLERVGQLVPLIRGDVADLPLATAVFDTVLATFPTDYIMDPAVLGGVYRVLRKDGRFLIIPGAAFTGTNPLHRFIEWLYAITGQREGPFEVDETGAAPPTAVWQTIQQRFADAGFSVEMEQISLSRSNVVRLIAHKHVGAASTPLVQSRQED
jgi:ubiquinone/menaquinone biosynthesis C-methylase UbiE